MGRATKMISLTLIVGFLFCITAQVIDLKNDELEVIDLKNDQLEVLDELGVEIPKQQKVFSRLKRSTKQLPARITFKTDIGITPNLYSKFSSKAEVDKWVKNLVKQANKLFSHPSLATTLTIQVMSIKRVKDNLSNNMKDSMEKFERKNYHLGVLGLGDNSGLGFAGSACRDSWVINGWRVKTAANFAIKLNPEDEIALVGALLAHEIGHVIGMHHNHKAGCYKAWGNGLMEPSVNKYSKKWTSCNNEQLREHCNWKGYLCL